jgi:hypothetical protein
MARTAQKTTDKSMAKTITSLTFNKDFHADQELISLANAYGRLPDCQGIPLTSAIRNLLLRTFKGEIQKHEQAEAQLKSVPI